MFTLICLHGEVLYLVLIKKCKRPLLYVLLWVYILNINFDGFTFFTTIATLMFVYYYSNMMSNMMMFALVLYFLVFNQRLCQFILTSFFFALFYNYCFKK